MPCNSDHMEPTQAEKNLAVVLGILEELTTGTLPSWYGEGTNHRVYNKTSVKEDLDINTAKLCAALNKTSAAKIKKMSLEAQTWWRDHQAADKKREEQEKQAAETEKLKQQALAKLTDEEKKALRL